MSNYQNDLMFNTLESQAELHFTDKCNELLKYYNKDLMMYDLRHARVFNSLFTSSILPKPTIHFIVLKKYYLSQPSNKVVSQRMHNLIRAHRFRDVETLISQHTSLRLEILQTYFNNMNTSNYDLALAKLETTSYDDINCTINAMNTFYNEQIYGHHPTQKKNYE